MTDEKHHNTGNQYAVKAPEDKRTSFLHIRVLSEDKGAWVRAARPGKLSAWVTDALNKAAAMPPTVYMNPETGSVGTKSHWSYINLGGDWVNAVDLGEVVEVEKDTNGDWVEV